MPARDGLVGRFTVPRTILAQQARDNARFPMAPAPLCVRHSRHTDISRQVSYAHQPRLNGRILRQ